MNLYVDFMNKRYTRELIRREVPFFNYWDDYALFLFENLCDKNEEKYYELLEEDIKLYSDFQTGTEREREQKCLQQKK